jgi:hypothetical protein
MHTDFMGKNHSEEALLVSLFAGAFASLHLLYQCSSVFIRGSPESA